MGHSFGPFDMPQQKTRPAIEQEAATQQVPKEPSMFLVVILNDDYTPYEFVVGVVSGIFKHSVAVAMGLAAEAHEQGRSVVGRYTKEIADTRVELATRLARSEGFPLTFLVEPEHESKPSAPGP